MRESRWGRRLGPGLAATAAVLAIASTTIGAPDLAGGTPPVCAGGTAAVAGPPGEAAWFRLDPVLTDGVRTGQRLTVGTIRGRAWALDLPAEAFATGPFDGRVVVGSDDGSRSAVEVVDPGRGCRTTVATSDDVIRRAILAPDRRRLVETRVRRGDRAALGIFERVIGGDGSRRLLEPLAADGRFGRTFATQLAWAGGGRTLVTATCGETACRYRTLEIATGRVRSVTDPALGPLVGVADDRLVVRGACRGLPCPVLAIDLATGHRDVLVAAAGLAELVVDRAGRPRVAAERDAAGSRLGIVDLDGRSAGPDRATDGLRLLDRVDDVGVEVPAGWLLLGPDGRLPTDLARDGRVHAVDRPDSRHLAEVLP